MKEVALKTVFFANSGGYSSKRVCGVLGLIVVLIIAICAFIFDKETPEIFDLILMMSASLLGLDNITNIFSKMVSKDN